MKFIFRILFFISVTLSLYSQNLSDLKKEKEKNLNEIEYLNELLKTNKSKEKSSLVEIKILDRKITLQNKLIQNINDEINILNTTVAKNLQESDSLQLIFEKEKQNYVKTLLFIQKTRNKNSELMFLLSSESFNQAYKRFKYLEQYTNYQKTQTEKIKQLKIEVDKNIKKYNDILQEKKNLYEEKESKTIKLGEQKEEQKQNLSQLKKKEKDLFVQIERKKKIIKNIQSEVNKIIAEEGGEETASPQVNFFDVQKLTVEFEKNKGKMKWPVLHGIVTEKFGEHYHPIMKKVKIKNDGVSITTSPNSKAQAVYKGVVSNVIAIPGANKVILIKHGDYYSVYSNLYEVYVNKGDIITQGKIIGQIFTDKNRQTTLLLQIYKNTIPQNPELWLGKK